jgi:hypothetical protein
MKRSKVTPVELKMETDREVKVETGLEAAALEAEQTQTADGTEGADEDAAAQAVLDQHKSDAPIKIIEPPRPKTFLEQVHDRIRDNRLVAEKEPERPKPMMSDRQRDVRDAELEAGRKAQAKAQEQQANRPRGPVQTKEGVMSPVHRPADFVEYANIKGPNASKDSK